MPETIPCWAADTSGGVIERPGILRTPRERSRWEVPAISWAAAGELAVLLDGPQGLSAQDQRLTVSLLRAPTWPDPGADNGWQRMRLALMPAPGGWRRASVPDQARRFREPLWCRPAQTDPAQQGETPEQPPRHPGGWGPIWPSLPPLGEDLRLVGLRVLEPPGRDLAPEGETVAVLSVSNEGPCRRLLKLPAPWRVLSRLNGLDQPISTPVADAMQLAPWQHGFWAISVAW